MLRIWIELLYPAMPVASRDTKIRGEVGSPQAETFLWQRLNNNSIILNQTYNIICTELVAIKEGTATHLYKKPGDRESLQALIEVILEMPNKSANFALTRLVGHPSWNTLDGTVSEIQRSFEVVLKNLEKAENALSKIDDSKKGAAEKKAALEERIALATKRKSQFETALGCFKRVDDEGWAPLSDLFTREITHPLIEGGTWQVSEIGAKLTDLRPLFNEAVQALKSNYRLQEEYAEKLASWNAKKQGIKSEPEWVRYEPLSSILAKDSLGKPLSKLSPEEWGALIQNRGELICKNWCPQNKLIVPDELLKSAEKASDSTPKSRKAIFWRSQLFKLNPELKALYDFHQKVEGVFGKPPKKPYFTLPDPLDHPRAIIWERTQCRNIRLASDTKGSQGKTIEIEIPLLEIKDGKLKTSPTWVSASGDKRLIEGIRTVLTDDQTEVLQYKDKVTGDWIRFEFGAVRLQKDGSSKDSDGNYRLIFTQKSEDKALPDWTTHIKEGLLPKNLIAVSFVHDPKNQGILKIAKISGTVSMFYDEELAEFFEIEDRLRDLLPEEHIFTTGERRCSFLKQGELEALNLPYLKSTNSGAILSADAAKTEDIISARQRAEMLKERNLEHKEKLNKAKRDLETLIKGSGYTNKELRELSDLKKNIETSPKAERVALPNDFPSELIRKYNQLNQTIRVQEKNLKTRIEGNWKKVRDHGEDRVQSVAGHVIRAIERIRVAYPGFEVALILPEEVAHKPRKIFSGHTNQEKMASQEGALYLKIVQMADGRFNPIPVFRAYDYGLDEISPTSSRTTVLKVTYDKGLESFRAPQSSDEPLQVFFVVKKEDGSYSINKESTGAYGLKGSNSIRVFADSSTKPTEARIKLNAASAASFLEDPKFLEELNRRFANSR